MECRNSPVAKTPPKDLPTIPGVTSPTSDEPSTQASQSHLHSSPEDKRAGGESYPGPGLGGGLSVLRNSTFQGEGNGDCLLFEEQLWRAQRVGDGWEAGLLLVSACPLQSSRDLKDLRHQVIRRWSKMSAALPSIFHQPTSLYRCSQSTTLRTQQRYS